MKMNNRNRYDASIEKRAYVDKCESQGILADSMDVRIALVQKVKSGECTLDEMKSELKRIKRDAAKNGMTTRSKAYNSG